ncbi:uncharacterized protein LOC144859252 isoform X2 [Branchiostoma floridae x Branchiostoma japonicum]
MNVSVRGSARNGLLFSLCIHVVTKCLADSCAITCSSDGDRYCDPLDRQSFLTCTGTGPPYTQPCPNSLVCVQVSETVIMCGYDTGTAESTSVSWTPMSSAFGSKSTQISITTGSHNQTEGEASLQFDTVIIAATTAGATFLLVLAVTITFVIIRRRSKAREKQEASVRFSVMDGHLHPTMGGTANQPFSGNTNVDELYAKPDKKKIKREHPQQHKLNPDDPSYQDVIPTGAQHQHATVQDEPQAYTAVRDEHNLYDSIQDDQQYATVQKGRKHDPNVATNPLYGNGSVDNTAYDPGPLSNGKDRAPSVCEMVDNVIYE